MSEPTEPDPSRDKLRDRILGLGPESIRKSYYPELQRRLRELAQSEQRYRTILDTINEGLIIHDARTADILYINPKMLEMIGLREETPPARVGEFSSNIPPYTQQEAIQRVQAAGHSRTEPFEWQARKSTGELFWIEVSLAPFEVDGQARVLASVRDVTQRKQMEEQLQQAQKMEAMGQLAGGVAHDFNNILTGIMGNAELLNLSLPSDSPEAEFARQITQASTRAASIVRQLLAFSRKSHLQALPVNLHEVIDDVIAILGHSIDKRIEIHRDLHADSPVVMGTAPLLENMLLNLGLNARDAMPDGGTLTFATHNLAMDRQACPLLSSVLEAGTYIEIVVSDTGVGMDEATLRRIFEPFFTTKEAGKGTGLGLAGVYTCVKNHRGCIQVRSRKGQGSSFAIRLPAQTAPAPAEGQVAAAEGPAPTGRGMILVVDDEQLVRNLAARALETFGYTIATACDGQEALDYVTGHRGQLDLVILDMSMPRVSGPEALRAIRRLDPDLPIILASGYSGETTSVDLTREKNVYFLHKPFRLADLQQQVQKSIRPRQ